MQRHVYDNHGLGEAQASAKVAQCAADRGGSQAMHDGDVNVRKNRTPDHQTGERRRTRSLWNSRLDRITWFDIDAMQPCRGSPRESCDGWQAQASRLEPQSWRFGEPDPDIGARSRTTPARAFKMPSIQPGPLSVSESERAGGQLHGYHRLPRHGSSMRNP